VAAPMLPLRLFRNRAFSGSNALTFAQYFSLAAISFYQPMTLIAGWGVTPALVSVSFLPVGICLTLLSPVSGGLADRYVAQLEQGRVSQGASPMDVSRLQTSPRCSIS